MRKPKGWTAYFLGGGMKQYKSFASLIRDLKANPSAEVTELYQGTSDLHFNLVYTQKPNNFIREKYLTPGQAVVLQDLLEGSGGEAVYIEAPKGSSSYIK